MSRTDTASNHTQSEKPENIKKIIETIPPYSTYSNPYCK